MLPVAFVILSIVVVGHLLVLVGGHQQHPAGRAADVLVIVLASIGAVGVAQALGWL